MVLLCASLIGENEEEFLHNLRGLEADIIEIRADGLINPSPEVVHNLLSKVRQGTKAKVILTLRSSEEGGKYKGEDEDRKKTILGSIHLIHMIDIELNSPFREEVMRAARSNGVTTIVSYHDFKSTPSKERIVKIIEDESRVGADYSKVAFQANNKEDVLNLMNATWAMSEKTNVIAISMGELGRITRLTAPFFGSKITYASVGKKSAPGQMNLEDTRDILRSLGVLND